MNTLKIKLNELWLSESGEINIVAIAVFAILVIVSVVVIIKLLN